MTYKACVLIAFFYTPVNIFVISTVNSQQVVSRNQEIFGPSLESSIPFYSVHQLIRREKYIN
ncbi:MAG: hypothetical protein A2149_06775 [Candidatus Schekmanbacteria bacterium RBG_16_38_11]|uniref:Uncharacterized protein n=1 Tax=Candidatus Schekmanbacteria bacterium RBG_16_38_11 TaxID=1817880 RepID=A0A1F7RVG3_9BACT|nr:MAG: hypothetical protein A2149_06775 [Candidatus Schekmanbacteria bacterium RBG_16_38_11]